MMKIRQMGAARLFGRIVGFARDKSGAFAMQFGLMVIPLVLCVGLAIDGGRVFLARFNLASALDAAALAMGSTVDPNVDLNAVAALYVDENFRMADTGTVALVSTPATITPNTETITLRGTVAVQTYFMPLAGVSTVDVSAESVVRRGGADVEVAMVLDTTGSMAGGRIEDLKDAAQELVGIVVNDVQTPYYSKVSMIPYSNSVYVGSLADTVRGAPPAGVNITGGELPPAPALSIYNAQTSGGNKVRVYSSNHGLSNNDIVTISGVNGMTQLNGGPYKVKNSNTNHFRLKYHGGPRNGQWVKSHTWPSYTSGGEVSEDGGGSCSSDCEVTLTAPAHGFSNGDRIRIEGATGWGEMNNSGNETWEVEQATANTFKLKNSDGSGWGTYTGNGQAFCTTPGCKYQRYTNASGNTRVKQITQCVTERVGSQQYTDASYTTKGVGFHYPSSTGNYSCSTDNELVPLTANKTDLHNDLEALTTSGSTAGHIGLAWGYYTLSDNWNALWPNASQQAGAMGSSDLVKAIVMMTDGEFNTGYCNGVNANDSFGNNDNQINCNSQNGGYYAQATALCNAIKADGIHLYTVGFEISAGGTEDTWLASCASSSEHYYLASNGAELTAAFNSIAKSISLLRLAQ